MMTHKQVFFFFFLAQRTIWRLSNGIFPRDSESHQWGLVLSKDTVCCGPGDCQTFPFGLFSRLTLIRLHCICSASVSPFFFPSISCQLTLDSCAKVNALFVKHCVRDCDGNRRLVRVRDYFKAGKEDASCCVPSQFFDNIYWSKINRLCW